jgi:hypothetical protein
VVAATSEYGYKPNAQNLSRAPEVMDPVPANLANKGLSTRVGSEFCADLWSFFALAKESLQVSLRRFSVEITEVKMFVLLDAS